MECIARRRALVGPSSARPGSNTVGPEIGPKALRPYDRPNAVGPNDWPSAARPYEFFQGTVEMSGREPGPGPVDSRAPVLM